MNYKETLEFLFGSLPVFENRGAGAYKPGLERVREFAASLGDPQNRYRTIHIAGTNGKGSTSHMLASVLKAAGYRTGLYTSPHLLDFRERIRVDGEMISESGVVEFTGRHKEKMLGSGMTFFEMATVMAFDWFAREGVDIAVIETGLGGRLDATNILLPSVSVITNIGLDHTQYLGESIPQIAAEKAGIIKPGVPVVVGEWDAASGPVFTAKGAELHSPVIFADREYKAANACTDNGSGYDVSDPNGKVRTYTLDLAGEYQKKNLLTVLATIDILRQTLSISEKELRGGLAATCETTGLAGRWQVVGTGPLIVCDTAHNAHGLAEVVRQIADQKYDRLHMVLGFVADKDLGGVIPLMPREARYIFTSPSVGRAMPAGRLRTLFAEHGIEGEAVVPVKKAILKSIEAASPADMIYIGGSNFTVADALPLFHIKVPPWQTVEK